MKKNKYSLIRMRNNHTGEEFDIDMEVTLNHPVMFTQVRWGENKGKFQWTRIRKGDMKYINWR